MPAPFTLQQLLQPQTLEETKLQLLAFLQAGGFPAITEWATEPTGTEMSFVEMLCRAINQLAQSGAPVDQQIASVARGNFLAWAKSGWLDLLAEQVYQLTRDQPTYTTFQMTLASVIDAPAYQFDVGDVWLVGPSGRRYQSTTAGNLEPGGEVEIAFQAEAIGSAYTDDPSQVTLQLATAFAGVTLKVGAGDFTIVTNTGGSTGRIQPERTTNFIKPTPHRFAIQIVVGGDLGTATWALQVDDEPFVHQGLLLISNTLPDGTSVLAINGESPSFVAGDTFVFSTPGSPNYVQGDDEESDERLAQRCSYRWPSLSLNVLRGKAALWAVTANPSINRVKVQADTVTPGRFLVIAADSHGSVDRAGLDKVEAFIKPRLGVGEDMSATTPTNMFVYARGNVKVPRSTTAIGLQDIQEKANEDWRKYVSSTDIGPAEVRKARLVEILIEAGALDTGDVDPLVLNADGVDWPINVDVGAGRVAVVGDDLTRTLTWGFA